MYSGFCHGTHCIKTLLEKVARHITYPQNKVANHEQWRSQESRQEGLLPLLPPLAPPLLLLPSQICRRGFGGLHGDHSGRGGLSPSRPTAASAAAHEVTSNRRNTLPVVSHDVFRPATYIISNYCLL